MNWWKISGVLISGAFGSGLHGKDWWLALGVGAGAILYAYGAWCIEEKP